MNIEVRHGNDCPKKADKAQRCNRRGCSYRGNICNPVTKKIEKGPRYPDREPARTWYLERHAEVLAGIGNPTNATLAVAW